MPVNTLENVLPDSSPELKIMLLEYYELASLYHLSEQQEERLSQILEQATCSEILAFWIAEIDHILSHKLSLLELEDRKSYQDQKAFLREYLTANPTEGTPKAMSATESYHQTLENLDQFLSTL